MEKNELLELLDDKHQILFDWLENHDMQKWESGPQEKWTTGQQIRHLIQSIQPLNKALKIPKFLLAYKFGKSNRNTRSFDELVAKYQLKVKTSEGIISPFSKGMEIPSMDEKASMIKLLEIEKESLKKKIGKWSEKDLDKYILPHPLLGRMPIREMIMFTGYHTEHHTLQLKNNGY